MPKKRFRMNYLKQIYRRYHKSDIKNKSKILDEFCKVCGYHRKYAVRILNAPPPDGDFINSLSVTDIHSAWTQTKAIMGKGQRAALDAIKDIQKVLPFEIRGIVNYHLLKYCLANSIKFTRSRPYKKDDNAHIEQKNWTHVRKIFGYVRYDSSTALNAMNDIYSDELNILQNLFLPSQKLVEKVRSENTTSLKLRLRGSWLPIPKISIKQNSRGSSGFSSR